jgi:hypothetical protein
VRHSQTAAITGVSPAHEVMRGAQGWVTVPAHHADLWADTLAVERRPLAVYEEVTTWN